MLVGKFRLKKSYHTQLARKKVKIMTIVYLEKELGNPKITTNKTPKVVSVGCVGLWKHNGVLSEFGKIREPERCVTL